MGYDFMFSTKEPILVKDVKGFYKFIMTNPVARNSIQTEVLDDEIYIAGFEDIPRFHPLEDEVVEFFKELAKYTGDFEIYAVIEAPLFMEGLRDAYIIRKKGNTLEVVELEFKEKKVAKKVEIEERDSK